MGQTMSRMALVPLTFVGLAAIAGCVDEKIVYQDRALFDEPLAAAQSFLGYTDHDTKLVVCGNCHVEKQADWETTGHSHAWVDLQDTGHAQPTCEACHSVGENGNLVDTPAGWNATQEARYEDVQCEACHGPGLEHVTNPSLATIPKPALNVGADAVTGCGECHQGTHHGFVDEWAQSRHGDASTHKSYRTRDECRTCHGGEGALEAWGVNSIWLEKGEDQEIGVTCAVCHDPHGSAGNDHQLRWPIDSRDVDTNLCMKCHQRRATPDPTSAHGPHSPQGPLLLGENVGWTPPNFQYNDQTIRGTHGSEANTELCATCHLHSYDVTDPETGGHIFSVTGHLFKPIPCLDSLGVPTGLDDSCGYNTTERTFSACTASGCHGSEDAALSAYLLATGRIADLVEELDSMLAIVEANDSSLFSTEDSVYTIAEGARFNAELGAIKSSAIHNPFLTEALLTASIDAVQNEYGPFPLIRSVPLRNILWEMSQGGN